MFPDVQETTIRHLRSSMTTSGVVDVLLNEKEKSKPLSLQGVLNQHCRQNMNLDDECVLKTNRHCLWNKAQVFYKRAIATSPVHLKRGLMIEGRREQMLVHSGVSFLKRLCSV